MFYRDVCSRFGFLPDFCYLSCCTRSNILTYLFYYVLSISKFLPVFSQSCKQLWPRNDLYSAGIRAWASKSGVLPSVLIRGAGCVVIQYFSSSRNSTSRNKTIPMFEQTSRRQNCYSIIGHSHTSEVFCQKRNRYFDQKTRKKCKK